MSLPLELIADLAKAGLETRVDPVTRVLYSTDASIYQIEPLGVAFPRRLDHLNAAVELAAKYSVPVIARGAGSGLAGQAIGAGLILDCSRYLDRILEIDPQAQTATVQPGVVLGALNRATASHGLQFGPDPASADRATVGGVIANNATGAHSIVYGMTADHLLEVEVVLGDGSVATFGEDGRPRTEDGSWRSAACPELSRRVRGRLSACPEPGRRATGHPSSVFHRTALHIRENHADAIRAHWPRTWRNVAGYNLNYLLPWFPSTPPLWPPDLLTLNPLTSNSLNLAPLFAGSEGTLGIIRTAKLRLVRKPAHTILAVLAYDSIAEAAEATPGLLELGPSAVEMITRRIIRLARSVPAYARQITFVTGDPAAMLVVEFAGDDPNRLKERVRDLGAEAYVAESAEAQAQIWGVRKVGLGLLMSRFGDAKPVAFIDDITVPVEFLGAYVREVERITRDHDVEAAYYAHASAGCLHIRPILDLKSPRHISALRSIAEQATSAGLRFGGTISGEHGDGLARSEWLERAYGTEIVGCFRELKRAADPQGILNPGKIVDPPPMDQNLRYGADYRSQDWQPTLSFGRQGGLAGAIEMCSGVGVCRKTEGVMCPSFQVTREEMYSTRGRANLLRELIDGRRTNADGRQTTDDRGRETESPCPPPVLSSVEGSATFSALDLCLACKGCKSECPSAVDMAKLKYEFLHEYYRTHRRKLRDYLFGYFGVVAQLGHPFGKLVNWGMGNGVLWGMFASLLGLAPERRLPRFRVAGKLVNWGNGKLGTGKLGNGNQSTDPQSTDTQSTDPQYTNLLTYQSTNPCLLLLDPFTQHFHPEAKDAVLRVLAAAGYQAQIIPVSGAGRTLISKGFLDAAKKHAQKVIAAIHELDPEGKLPILGIEPSEIYTLSDEYPDFFPEDEQVAAIAKRAWMIDEFLVRPGANGKQRMANGGRRSSVVRRRSAVLLHGHCYQKARPPADDGYPVGVDATVAMLEAAGYEVEVVEAGCCGMAGAFGYEAEHYELSMQVGELALFPAVRAAGENVIVAAAGVSCQAQIEDGTAREAVHPITLLAR